MFNDYSDVPSVEYLCEMLSIGKMLLTNYYHLAN